MSIWQKVLKQIPLSGSAKRRPRRPDLRLEMLEERAVPATIYVRTDGSDSNAGTSPGLAVASIQKALNLTKTINETNTVLVASGTYKYDDTLAADSKALGYPAVVGIVDQQVTIKGGFNSQFTGPVGVSIIDGGGQNRGVFVMGNKKDASVILDGFTIQNSLGTPTTLGGSLTGVGGGLLINKSFPRTPSRTSFSKTTSPRAGTAATIRLISARAATVRAARWQP